MIVIKIFYRVGVLAGLFFVWAPLAFGQGGPPLVTDDPGTPGDGHAELNFASQSIISGSGSAYQFPALDLNYGYGDTIQLNVNVGWVFNVGSDASTANGGSLASLATKWRFVEERNAGIAISTFPRLDFHSPLSSNNPSINAQGNRYFLPIEISKQVGRWRLNPEIGYAYYSQLSPEWVYGFATGYEIEKDSKELLSEIHGRRGFNTGNGELFFQIGTRYRLTERWKLIGAFGRSIKGYADGLPFWTVYAGVQFHT